VNRRVHVVGAGLAGLSAAVRLAAAGHSVDIYESAGHAGGRCRSFHDQHLDQLIDNGNHLLLSGNRAVLDYLREIGSADSLTGPERAAFPFFDLAADLRWTVRPDRGVIPWSIFSAKRRVPGSTVGEYLRGLRLARARPDDTVAQCLGADSVLYRRFWEPLAVSVLNTDAAEGSAQLLWPVIRETFGRGEAACRPLMARQGLSESFVTPALAYLQARGGQVAFQHRLRQLVREDGRIGGLDFGNGVVGIGADDSVVLAVPPAMASELVPGLSVPSQSRAIVNGHFRVPDAPRGTPFLGLVGGTAQWLFVRGDIVSVTVSAADQLAEQPADEIARLIWSDVSAALALPNTLPERYRIVKEQRATFAQTPEQVTRRPGAQTEWDNLFLAGDWTDTGLPATIEGTIRSGNIASEMIMNA
jgi:squalene-associated FAD-dependent desaturase